VGSRKYYFLIFLLAPILVSVSLVDEAFAPYHKQEVKPQPEQSESKATIPDWIRNNAKWWSEGQIGDSDFVSGIQFMIKENIMIIPDLPEEDTQKMELKDEKRAMGLERDKNVPDWVRNNAGWWADGLISDDDFVSGIKYLIQNGIITVEQKLAPTPSLNSDDTDTDLLALDFTYEAANSELKKSLSLYGISMSSMIEIRGSNIEKYCSFFSDPAKQKLVEYCTSTEISDLESIFLGNIHMVGSTEKPRLVMAILQADPKMSQIENIKTIFETVTETLVCDCWEDMKPGGYDTIKDWIEALSDFHTIGDESSSKSSPIQLDEKRIQIELTTNVDGYLWKLFVAR